MRSATAPASTPLTPWPATLQPRADMIPVTDAAGLAAKPAKGWFDDLPLGQRIVVPVQAALSLVAYVGTSPQTDPCLTGQPATLYARQYGSGNSLLLDDTGAMTESIFEAEGIVGIELVAIERRQYRQRHRRIPRPAHRDHRGNGRQGDKLRQADASRLRAEASDVLALARPVDLSHHRG